jgi:hypothetical protein
VPAGKQITDGRRKAANDAMAALGQSQADADHLFTVLSTPPVLAGSTTYTMTSSNALGTYATTVREHNPALGSRRAPNPRAHSLRTPCARRCSSPSATLPRGASTARASSRRPALALVALPARGGDARLAARPPRVSTSSRAAPPALGGHTAHPP